MYGTPEERAAKLEAAKSAVKLHPIAKVDGKATRVPVSSANGFLTEKRFRETWKLERTCCPTSPPATLRREWVQRRTEQRLMRRAARCRRSCSR